MDSTSFGSVVSPTINSMQPGGGGGGALAGAMAPRMNTINGGADPSPIHFRHGGRVLRRAAGGGTGTGVSTSTYNGPLGQPYGGAPWNGSTGMASSSGGGATTAGGGYAEPYATEGPQQPGNAGMGPAVGNLGISPGGFASTAAGLLGTAVGGPIAGLAAGLGAKGLMSLFGIGGGNANANAGGPSSYEFGNVTGSGGPTGVASDLVGGGVSGMGDITGGGALDAASGGGYAAGGAVQHRRPQPRQDKPKRAGSGVNIIIMPAPPNPLMGALALAMLHRHVAQQQGGGQGALEQQAGGAAQ